MDGPMRIVTYNVHRCQGIDGRYSPRRVLEVLQEISADVVALQEVVSKGEAARHDDQARFLAEELGLQLAVGHNRKFRGGDYGNVVLSRFPLGTTRNHDISVRGRERRGCFRADLRVGDDRTLHLFNVHLGTSYLERRRQARLLTEGEILKNGEITGPRLVLGDFNEWTAGLTSRLLSEMLNSVDIRMHLRRTRTYPGFLPVMHLDHMYFDDELQLEKMTLHRTRKALMASDHLPLVGEFSWRALRARGGSDTPRAAEA
jgi:endonuclease/exonuclease/phosphatase family metal-dependent hydrolase